MTSPAAAPVGAAPSKAAYRRCIHEVFDDRASATPEAVAIECAEKRWTYAEIAAASRSFAADLRRAGVRPGAVVGIGIGRSVEFVVAVLAVLRCGAAYAPLPCDDPVERLASMVDAAGMTTVVTVGEEESCSPLFRARPSVVRLSIDGGAKLGLRAPAAGEHDPACDPEAPAAVMFTSGSTGTPKGVVVPHRAIVGLVTGQTYADFGPGLRTVMAAPTAFDASTFELWGPLLHGGTAVVYPDRHFDLRRFRDVVRVGRVNSVFLTSGLFNQVVDHLPEALDSLRHVITGGDVASAAHFRRALDRCPGLRLTNAYGPTETTTFACTHDIDPADTFPDGSIPLGRPLAHTFFLVVAEDGHPLPDGEPGELWIGGSGVATGYLSGSEGKFVADPRPEAGAVAMYRSGDRCRRLPDGTLLFLGRIDQQVKIRGHRIEPGEIEATLLKHPLIRAAAVIPFKRGGETTLAAFVTRIDRETDAIDTFHPWLEAHLPRAFVPARVVVVEALPINPNGKLDRGRLLALLEASHDRPASAPPRPGTEATLAAPWRELLGGPPPGRDDDFFAAGGHSLLAMRLVAAIEREFRVRLSVTAVFETRTLSRLAAAIDAAAGDGADCVAADDVSVEPSGLGADERLLPALPAQRGMWLLDAVLPDRATYNQPFAFRADRPVDRESLRRALGRAMARHGALRSCLVDRGDGPVQRILPIAAVEVPWAEEPLIDAEAIEGALFDHGRRPFDLDTAPLWRATLFPRAAPHGVLLLTFHHAIIDDWSIELLLRELAEPGGAGDLADAAGRALAPLSPTERARGEHFWREALAGAPGALPWPVRSSPLDATDGRIGGLHRFDIGGQLAQPLRALARQTGATEFQILLAAFHAWVRRITGAEDVVVGTPVSLRRTPDEQASIGCFLNTLPVRVRWENDEATGRSFVDLVRRVGESFLAAVGHGALPFDEIVVAGADGRTGDRAPLVSTLFVATPAGVPAFSHDGATLVPIPVDTATAKFDLTLFLEGDGDGLRGVFEYDRRRFDDATIAHCATTFAMFLESVLTAPAESVERADLLPVDERRRVLHDFNDTAADLGPPATLQELFAKQVGRTPASIALECGNEILSYAELAGRVNRLARFLRSRGVGRDVPVAVCMERSVEMVVALLGIVTAGGAYLPLDPDYPTARIGAMLASAAPPVVLIQDRFSDRLGSSAVELFRLDSQSHELDAFDDGALDDVASPSDLAYVIYTSGSTGAPKGVMNTHAGIVNRLRWGQEAYRIGANDRLLQKTPFGFDVSVWEFFWPLLVGARLVVAPPELHRDPAALAELVEAAGITVIHFVPSMLEVFLAVPALERLGRSLRHVITSGEALGEGSMRKCLQLLPARLHNLYGPTEAAVEVTSHECRLADPPGSVPIGRPIANMRTYVLDAAMRPVGVGIEGELWLAGVGVARGYLGRPDLTAERFLLDPFTEQPGERMYRTGDLARWRPDGEIEYLGRLDHQVKIRGVRIELGEIESELEQIEGVTRAVVIDREIGPGDRRLVAYLVAEAFAPSDGALKALLAERLPEAMVPWRFVRVHALPLNANGKLDRAALPSPDAAIDFVEASPRSAPVGETEEALAAIWCELLGISAVGRDDGFFASGGHSLLSMRLVAAIERRFGVCLPVKTVFETPKLADLAARISQPPAALPESTVAFATLPATDRVIECRPLPMQRGMWLLHSLLPDPAAYNVPIAWRVDGPIDWPRLERALAAVVHRHPALRTALVDVDGDLVQQILPTEAVAVPLRTITIAEEAGLPAALRLEASAPFDLAVAPLLRAVRFDVAAAEPVLMLSFHHAIVDEWSIGIIRRDLVAAYTADGSIGDGSQPIVTSVLGSADVERHRQFWREKLAGVPLETPLPGRSEARAVGANRCRTRRFRVGGGSLARLRRLADSSNVTMFNLLLASAHAWLQRITGQRDLVVGTPVATRGAAETVGAVGCLINVLPVRVRFDDGLSLESLTLPGLAARVQEIFLRALDHADLPFDEIVASAVSSRQGVRQPLVNVLLTVVEVGSRSWSIDSARLHPLPVDTGMSRFDLSLTLQICPDGLEGSLEVAAGLIDDDTVAALATRYESFLAEAATDAVVPIDRMAMLSAAERRQVIEDFNATAVDLGPATTLHRLVAEQSVRTPTAVAVRDGDRTVTYAELHASATRLALRLRQRGIGPADRVGVALPRSIDAVVAMLGVLRAGAAWVPLDREASPARAAFIASDAGLAAIVGAGASSRGWPMGIPVVDPADAGPVSFPEDLLPDVDPGGPAYVMYTSGSTGQPKGVVIPHGAVVNYLRGKQRRFPLDPADVMLHATRTTFDISVYEVFAPLMAGAALAILPPGRTDPVRVAELVREAGVTVAQFVPSLLALLVDDDSFVSCPTLRRVFCGGEAMPVGVMERFLERSAAELINIYGPTEATVWATAWVCRRSEIRETPPIGRPLDNVRCYVLDSARQPVPVGSLGELFIGGAQLALGYHDRPDLTSERFLPDPFLPMPGARMYRTGDVCRWRPDGQLEFVTRTDQQVKIRGHRIEPAEIEACLAGHPEIAAVAVVVVDPPAGGAAMLVAGVVPRGSAIDPDALRGWTAERLPEAMVPSRFSSLDALPVNANGKVDRAALTSHLATSTVAASALAPRLAGGPSVLPVFLSQVRAAWQRVFGRVDFGDEENFFHDLGGQSLMAARLVADLSAGLGRRVPLAAVFEAPTVMSMAALLRDEGWTPRFRSIVPLQPLGIGPPLFLFHGIGGGVTETLDLARAFGPDVPVYGLQAIDRDGGEMQASLEACGALYAAEIVDFQPRGPYFLGGFSLGGWFAYETARQLLLGGHEVALLAQFDTHINCILPDEAVGDSERVISRQYVWKHLLRFVSHPAHWWRYLSRLPGRYRLARRWRAVDPIRTDSHGAIVAKYRALPYLGPVDYFQSADSLPAVLGVWQRWCPGGLTVYRIPGQHHEIIHGANATIVASIIRGIIRDRAPKGRGAAEPADGSAP